MQDGLALYAEMQERAAKLQEAMKAEKQRQGKTNQQMIEESGVARSTVNNYFAGVLGGPGLVQTAALCKVLGMSIDNAMGLSPASAEDVEKLREELAHKEELIRILSGGVKARRPLIYGLLGLCALLGMALMMYIILDVSRPDVGLIRTDGVSPILIVLCLVGVCGGLWTACRAVKDRVTRRHGER
nr:MAG TPA: LAMBDA REPRESSOR (TRIPLE MUTANT)/DNA COMPLEX-DNA COMPLEX, DOUBLE HELIX, TRANSCRIPTION-DNA.1A [Caudoviricetes sp.]